MTVPSLREPLLTFLLPAVMRRGRQADDGAEFAAYARLVKGQKQSGGKTLGTGGATMGNVHRKGAFSEASVLFLRPTTGGKTRLAGIEHKHGNGQALSMLAHKTGRAVFDLLSRGTVFSMETFLAASQGRARVSHTAHSSPSGPSSPLIVPTRAPQSATCLRS